MCCQRVCWHDACPGCALLPGVAVQVGGRAYQSGLGLNNGADTLVSGVAACCALCQVRCTTSIQRTTLYALLGAAHKKTCIV